jgi:hypothetical protein
MHTFGPLSSYKDNKFIVIIREEATGYTKFCAAKDGQPSTLANILIKNWTAKLSLPRTLITGLPAEENQVLRNHISDLLGLESNHLIMESTNAHKLPNDIIDQLHTLVEETELSWEDFIPVLSFLHNTSYDSRVHCIPFKLLHGYNPETPIEIKHSYSDSEANKELQMYQRVKRLLLKPTAPASPQPVHDTNPAFQVGQEVYFWEKSYGELKWNGPYPIIKVLPHKIFLTIFPPRHPNGSTTIAFPLPQIFLKQGRRRRKMRHQETQDSQRSTQKICGHATADAKPIGQDFCTPEVD